jgi:hypothetical protein
MSHDDTRVCTAVPNRSVRRPPPPPSIRRHCTGNHNAATRFTKYDVAEIRRWARTDGFGLGPTEQARRLQIECPGYTHIPTRTLVSVLVGDTWPDPAYDRTTPLPEAVPTAERVAWWPLLTGAPVWFVLAILWRTVLCGDDFSRGRAATR